jgi:hypothetical protein
MQEMSERSIAEELEGGSETLENFSEPVQYVQDDRPSFIELLKTPTGEGTIEEYLIHPLNFNESKGMARVLRGLTGFLGNINLAIADIIIGALDVLKTTKKGQESNDNNRGVSSFS